VHYCNLIDFKLLLFQFKLANIPCQVYKNRQITALLPFSPIKTLDNIARTRISREEYLHSSVLGLCITEPYVPLRNATKRKRLRTETLAGQCFAVSTRG